MPPRWSCPKRLIAYVSRQTYSSGERTAKPVQLPSRENHSTSFMQGYNEGAMRSVFMTFLFAATISAVDLYASNAPCTDGASILDEKHGFRDVKLGAVVSEIPGLRVTEVDIHDRDRFNTKEVSAYTRATDSLTIYGQRLASITYLVFKERVFAIVLRWGQESDGGKILEGFEAALGCPRKYDLGQAKTDVQIEAISDQVWFVAWHRVIKNVGAFGEAAFHHRALLHDVNQQIRREAATEF